MLRVAEEYPAAGSKAVLLHASAQDSARWVEEHTEGVDLVYIDPPFAAARDFRIRTQYESDSGVESFERVAFSDRWESLDEYLGMMEGALNAVHSALHPEGSLLLHCDHRAAPYLSVICDRLFGFGDRLGGGRKPGFRNELVWEYGLGGSSHRNWPRKHDTILWYSKGTRWYFDAPRVPATSQRMRGQLKKAPDVIRVPTLNNMAGERCGYPTQKPLQLLSLLIDAHCPPGGSVADYFSGSGTCAVAALRSGRRVFAGDMGDDGVAMTRARVLGECEADLTVLRSTQVPAAPAFECAVRFDSSAMTLSMTSAGDGITFAAGGTRREGVFVAQEAKPIAVGAGAITLKAAPHVVIRTASGGEFCGPVSELATIR